MSANLCICAKILTTGNHGKLEGGLVDWWIHVSAWRNQSERRRACRLDRLACHACPLEILQKWIINELKNFLLFLIDRMLVFRDAGRETFERRRDLPNLGGKFMSGAVFQKVRFLTSLPWEGRRRRKPLPHHTHTQSLKFFLRQAG